MLGLGKMTSALLRLELTVAFGPVCLLLLLSLVVAAAQVVFLFTSEEVRSHPDGSLQVIAYSLAGTLALARFIPFALAIADARPPNRPTTIDVLAMVLGLAVLLDFLRQTDMFAWRTIFLLPILATVHFLYLGRNHLFSQRSPKG